MTRKREAVLYFLAVAIFLGYVLSMVAYGQVGADRLIIADDACSSLTCNASLEGRYCIDNETTDMGKVFQCVDTDSDGTPDAFAPEVIPDCGGSAPSGACTNNDACQDSGSLYLCNAGTWGAVSGGGGGGAPTDAQYIVLSLNGSLSDERTLSEGNGTDINTLSFPNVSIDLDLSELSQVGSAESDDCIAMADASNASECVLTSNFVAPEASSVSADSVALTTDTTGDYVQALGTGGDLTPAGNSGEASTPTASVTGLGGVAGAVSSGAPSRHATGNDRAIPCLDLWGPDSDNDGDLDPDGTCDGFFNGWDYVGHDGRPVVTAGATIVVVSADDIHSGFASTGGLLLGDDDGTLCEDSGDWASIDLSAFGWGTVNDERMWAACDAKNEGVPITWPAMHDKRCFDDTNAGDGCPDGCLTGDHDLDGTDECYYGVSGKAMDLVQSWGQSFQTHTGQHYAITPEHEAGLFDTGLEVDTTTGAYYSLTRNRAGVFRNDTDGDSTVDFVWDFTEGGTTVTFDQTAGGDPNILLYGTSSASDYGPIGAWVGLDCDGTPEDIEFSSHVIAVADVDGTSTDWEQLTLDDTIPSDCDGDGTPSETLQDRVVYIRSSLRTKQFELDAACQELEDQESQGAECDAFQAPGPWETHGWATAQMLAAGIQSGANPSPGDNSSQTHSGIYGVRAPRIQIKYGDDSDAVLSIVDRAVAGNAPLLYLWSHYPKTTGDAQDGNWSRTTFSGVMQGLKERMQQGKIIVTDPTTAMRLNTIWASLQKHRNLILNPLIETDDGFHDDDSQPEGGWPWFSTNSDISFDSDATPDFVTESPCSSDPCYAGITKTVWTSDTTDNRRIEQTFFADEPGWYFVRVAAGVEGFDHGTGLRACIERKPSDQSSNSGAGPDNNLTGNSFDESIRARWYVSPDPDLGGADGEGFDEVGSGCSDTIDSDMDGDSTADGIKEVEVLGVFYVDPFDAGAELTLKLWKIGGAASTAKIHFLDEIVVHHDVARDTLASRGPRSLVPRSITSYRPHEFLPGEGDKDPAFILENQVSRETHPDGVQTNPDRHLLGHRGSSPSDTEEQRFGITGSGTVMSKCIALSDMDDNDDSTRDEGPEIPVDDAALIASSDWECMCYDPDDDDFYRGDCDGVREAGENSFTTRSVVALNFQGSDLTTSNRILFSEENFGTEQTYYWPAGYAGDVLKVACHYEESAPGAGAAAVEVLSYDNNSFTSVWNSSEFLTTTTILDPQSEACTSGCDFTADDALGLRWEPNGSLTVGADPEISCTLFLALDIF